MPQLFENAPNNCCTGAREAGLVIVANERRAPGEHGVRHRTSSELSKAKETIVEKYSRTRPIF
jgi:hypothetical protein